MSALLTHSSYGKSRVRLTKITRHADHHELKELCVAIRLEGDFAASYAHGNNSQIITTDTMKNTVYVVARNHPLTAIEDFGLALARHFMENFAHVSASTIRLVERPWQRILVDGQEHPHAFVGGGREQRSSTVKLTRQSCRIQSGVKGLCVVKTTDSAFKGFLRDPYTTLGETDDRIFATRLKACWLYGDGMVDWNHCHELVRRTLLDVFAGHKSLSVQHTLYAMAAAALEACGSIQQIRLAMPNKHHLPVDLRPFGLDNPNMVFVPTEEPFGLIRATLQRA
jgi:urate oxidase